MRRAAKEKARLGVIAGITETLNKKLPLNIKHDVTERKHAEKEAQRNLERIRALREIDLAINSTFDLRTVLDVLLEKVQLFIPKSSSRACKPPATSWRKRARSRTNF
jgi:hypothetical protein